MTENGAPAPWACENVGGSQTTMSNAGPGSAKRSSALVASVVISSMRPAARPLQLGVAAGAGVHLGHAVDRDHLARRRRGRPGPRRRRCRRTGSARGGRRRGRRPRPGRGAGRDRSPTPSGAVTSTAKRQPASSTTTSSGASSPAGARRRLGGRLARPAAAGGAARRCPRGWTTSSMASYSSSRQGKAPAGQPLHDHEVAVAIDVDARAAPRCRPRTGAWPSGGRGPAPASAAGRRA